MNIYIPTFAFSIAQEEELNEMIERLDALWVNHRVELTPHTLTTRNEAGEVEHSEVMIWEVSILRGNLSNWTVSNHMSNLFMLIYPDHRPVSDVYHEMTE
ncbi:MAG: hypothetical protein FWE05_06795 [Defluviitaleaceae bacterium]|nr:hypothetical protein [Defluviitaleaceae bacterium]